MSLVRLKICLFVVVAPLVPVHLEQFQDDELLPAVAALVPHEARRDVRRGLVETQIIRGVGSVTCDKA